jgi:hypothetical protein
MEHKERLMNRKMPKNSPHVDEHGATDRYRRHPVLWLATYLIGLGLVVAMAIDWVWGSVMTSH